MNLLFIFLVFFCSLLCDVNMKYLFHHQLLKYLVHLVCFIFYFWILFSFFVYIQLFKVWHLKKKKRCNCTFVILYYLSKKTEFRWISWQKRMWISQVRNNHVDIWYPSGLVMFVVKVWFWYMEWNCLYEIFSVGIYIIIQNKSLSTIVFNVVK